MEGGNSIILVLGLALRIVGAIVCSNKAKKLNRNSGGWGFFGFISPIVAMIWINFMKPKNNGNNGMSEMDHLIDRKEE